jgi:hypothetical protein
MKKLSPKKIALHRETLLVLESDPLREVRGAVPCRRPRSVGPNRADRRSARSSARGWCRPPGNLRTARSVRQDMEPARDPSRWMLAAIQAGAAFFIFALVVSAIFDPTIRVLHTLQALIYVVVIVLVRRGSPWGFGAGFTIALFWNYTNLFVTTFIAAGLHQLAELLRTGRLSRPDLLIAVFAGAGHFLMIVGYLVCFLRLKPKRRQGAEFLTAGVLAVAYFVLIIWMTGPQYIPLIKKVFHLDPRSAHAIVNSPSPPRAG